MCSCSLVTSYRKPTVKGLKSCSLPSSTLTLSASHVDQRIEAFLEEFVRTVKNMEEPEVVELKKTLTSMKQTVDLTLSEEVERNWSEIVRGEYVFDRLKQQVRKCDMYLCVRYGVGRGLRGKGGGFWQVFTGSLVTCTLPVWCVAECFTNFRH